MKRTIAIPLALAVLALLDVASLAALEQVGALKDLVGVRGRDGEAQLEQRGFQSAGGSQAGDSSFTYWREPRTNRCVAVRTTDGHYASITYTQEADCQGGGAATQLPASAGGGTLQTVCGVETGGKTYRYRCNLRDEGCQGGGSCRTTVTMPDNEYTISWHKNDEIEVAFSGMNPMRSKSSFRDGQTRFDLEGKTYFLYRSPDRAKKELANFHE